MKTRENYIDVARGIAIISVVMGHTYIPTILHHFIYSFHMALFFIISGIFVSKKEIKALFVEKTKCILLPYMFWSLVTLLFWYVLNIMGNYFKIDSEAHFIFPDSIFGIFLCTRMGRYGGYLWFLMAIFTSFIVLNIISQKTNLIRNIVAILFLILETIHYYYFNDINLPFCLDVMPLIVVFMIFGEFWNKIHKIFPQKRFLILLLLVLYVCATVINIRWFGATYNMYSRGYGSISLFVISGVTGSYLILIICECLSKKKYGAGSMFLISKIEWLGRNSLTCYVLHDFVIIITRNIGKLLTKITCNLIYTKLFGFWAFQVLVSIVIVIYLGKWLSTNCPAIIGKK